MQHTMPKHIGDYNKNRMLSILRDKGQCSRVELSQLLGISATAVTKNVLHLINNGIIRECGTKYSSMGRKPILIELCGDFCYVIGADIVGGTVKAALADLNGNIVKQHEEPILRSKDAHAVLSQLICALRKVIAKARVPAEKIWVAAIGTPGIFDPVAGKSQFTFFLEDWEGIDIRSRVSESLSIETLIENDVNLDVIGESWKGVGKDYENILYVKLGQGLAARIVLENKLIRGEHKMAGEIGYMLPGMPSRNVINYENMLCNDTVSREYRKMTNTSSANTISDICELADKGDPAARKLIHNLLDRFAVVLLNSAAVLDTQVIILGGDACSFGEREIAMLKHRIEKHLPLIQNIIPSKLNKNACLYGAIKIGLDRVEERIINVL